MHSTKLLGFPILRFLLLFFCSYVNLHRVIASYIYCMPKLSVLNRYCIVITLYLVSNHIATYSALYLSQQREQLAS